MGVQVLAMTEYLDGVPISTESGGPNRLLGNVKDGRFFGSWSRALFEEANYGDARIDSPRRLAQAMQCRNLNPNGGCPCGVRCVIGAVRAAILKPIPERKP